MNGFGRLSPARPSHEQRIVRHDHLEQIRLHRHYIDTEIELVLAIASEKFADPRHQQPELDIGVSRTYVRDDLAASTDVLSDLDRSRTRSRTHSPDERHPETLDRRRLVRENALSRTHPRRSQRRAHQNY